MTTPRKLQYVCQADTKVEMLRKCLGWLDVNGMVTDGERERIKRRIYGLDAAASRTHEVGAA